MKMDREGFSNPPIKGLREIMSNTVCNAGSL
jgi:hypothetical protein